MAEEKKKTSAKRRPTKEEKAQIKLNDAISKYGADSLCQNL